jgi:flagellar biogenesis protein FliO
MAATAKEKGKKAGKAAVNTVEEVPAEEVARDKEEDRSADREGKTGREKDREKAAKEDSDLYKYEKPSLEEESTAWLIFKTIFVIGLLVGGFYYFFRFVTKKAGIQVLGRDVVQVMSIVPLGQNKFLQVVDLAGRILVLGVCDGNISLIAEIREKDEIDRIRLLSSKSTPVEQFNFQEYVVRHMGKFIDTLKEKGWRGDKTGRRRGHFKADEAGEAEVDRLDYLRNQKDRLKKLNGLDDEK